MRASTASLQHIYDTVRTRACGALCDLAQGFLDHPRNGLAPSAETCRLLYGGSLILLSRVLFLFCAQARGLLPDIEDEQGAWLPEGTHRGVAGTIRHYLTTLFAGVERATAEQCGSFPADVDEFHQFLDRYTPGEVGICQAIDRLAHIDGHSYRDLSARHLGTLYEGLLACTLQVASEPLVDVRSSGNVVPGGAVAQRGIARAYAPGQVYLVSAREGRRTTGSSYTPDYLVRYLVEEAIRPMLDETIAGPGACATDEEQLRAILAFKVLDPAMGSGYFLREVVEFLARYIVERDLQTGTSGGAPLMYWKRRVVQHCIYGVDLHPASVELARLSLWLTTAAQDPPRAF